MAKQLLITALAFLCSLANAATVKLIWDRNPEPDVIGYRVYTGNSSRSYDRIESAGNDVMFSVTNLVLGQTYYFAVTAVNSAGLESDYSNEVVYTVPSKPSAPANPRALLESVSWKATKPNKNGQVTPILVVPAEDGVAVTAVITTPAGQVTRTATVKDTGFVQLNGKAFVPPYTAFADITRVSIDPGIETSVVVE